MTLVSQAAVSLTISAVTGAANGALGGLAGSDGNLTSQRVWGILVDTNGNGFSLGNYAAGASLAANAANVLSTYIEGVTTTTDDVLYISPNLMVNSVSTVDGGTVSGQGRPTSFANVQTPNGSVGDQFYVVWFDQTTLGGVTAIGDKYGAFRIPAFTIPADGATVSFASNFVGAEPTQLANLSFTGVPEPSAAVLGALGALGLLRRRRN
jgi:MYXO-CTERM domain-containing protein